MQTSSPSLIAQFILTASTICASAGFETVRGELTTRIDGRRFFFKDISSQPNGALVANGHYCGKPARLIALKTDDDGFRLRHVMTGDDGFLVNRRYIGSGDLEPLQGYIAAFS